MAHATTSSSAFDAKYVSTNIRPNAPLYSKQLVESYRQRLLSVGGDDWHTYCYAVLSSVFIGAHRADHVPQLFEDAIAGIDLNSASGLQEAKEIYLRIRETIMVIWPFVGIPWCVPAGLGLVSVLQRHGIEKIAEDRLRGSFQQEDFYQAGRDIHLRTYEKVNNPEVRELLSIGLPEYREPVTALVWGFNIAGVNKSGLFKEHQTELLVATAISAEGASRQARSHIKASIAMGNSVEVVQEVSKITEEFAAWAEDPLPHSIDVVALANEVGSLEKHSSS